MKCKLIITLLAVVALVYITPSRGNENSKRILLSDPSYIHDLEAKLQDLTAKYTEISTKYTEISTQNTDLTAKYTEISTKNTELTAKYTELNNKFSSFSTTYQAALAGNGAVYIRWGRTICPDNSTELVYSGFAGGSYFNNYGSAAEYICLPPDPQWEASARQGGANHVYGAEYERTFRGTSVQNNDVPCSVCRSTTRTSVLMIPGRTSCYSDWQLEYQGFLAAGADSHRAATEFVCLDMHPEALQHGRVDEDGKLFYEVAAKCGSLPCPPYIDDRKMACVVCSK